MAARKKTATKAAPKRKTATKAKRRMKPATRAPAAPVAREKRYRRHW